MGPSFGRDLTISTAFSNFSLDAEVDIDARTMVQIDGDGNDGGAGRRRARRVLLANVKGLGLVMVTLIGPHGPIPAT
jgi:hypothetical protein